MSITSRIADRLRSSLRRRATKALDALEAWLLQAPRTSPAGEEPPPLVTPEPAASREPHESHESRASSPEPLEFPDPGDLPTADPTEPSTDEAESLADVHELPTSAASGLSFDAVEELLEDMVRPALQMDGGDIRLVRVEPEGDVFVELEGACTSCPSATITMRNGIERLMEDQLPGFRSLVEVHGVGSDGDAAPGPG